MGCWGVGVLGCWGVGEIGWIGWLLGSVRLPCGLVPTEPATGGYPRADEDRRRVVVMLCGKIEPSRNEAEFVGAIVVGQPVLAASKREMSSALLSR